MNRKKLIAGSALAAVLTLGVGTAVVAQQGEDEGAGRDDDATEQPITGSLPCGRFPPACESEEARTLAPPPFESPHPAAASEAAATITRRTILCTTAS